jgi:hypothetical protein
VKQPLSYRLMQALIALATLACVFSVFDAPEYLIVGIAAVGALVGVVAVIVSGGEPGDIEEGGWL